MSRFYHSRVMSLRLRALSFSMLAALLLSGCSTRGHVALLSDGDLENKDLAGLSAPGPVLKGGDCGAVHSLSAAVRDALKDSEYDTLVDVDIEATTWILTAGNCIYVQGRAVNSKALSARAEERNP